MDISRRQLRSADITDHVVPRTRIRFWENTFCIARRSVWNSLTQWCSGKFGTVRMLRSPLSLSFFSPPVLFSSLLSSTSPPLPYLVAIISMTFLRINLPQTLHFFASLRWENPHKIFGGMAFPLDYATALTPSS